MSDKKILIIRILITFILTLLLYYFMLPPINPTSFDLYLFILFIIIIYYLTGVIKSFNLQTMITNRRISITKMTVAPICIFSVFILIIIINFIMSPVFRSDAYSKRITIDLDSNFNNDVKQVSFNALPLLDKDSSTKLGDRVMGQMPELVSQFYVSDLYTQINYNDEITRVTPLEYDGIIKYFTNRGDGVKGYITVNSVSGEAKLTKLDKGMKYMPSAYFNENLYRHLRFSYPTEIFGDENFELDDDGNPYWIIPTIKYSGVEIKEEITGVIILDPITGNSKKYSISKIPRWVDHVYPSELIIAQVDDWGKYKNGFLNSIFGQKNVTTTTEGYNYTVMNDDVYLYTGITSATSDESILGFILSNLRTKETKFYSVAGAKEYSAMNSAKGQVQQMGYNASFPLLINLNNKPTYLISLKDNAGLVKMYAFVDVTDYQKVVVTDASKGIEVAAKNYMNELNIDENTNQVEIKYKDITIKSITSAIIDGNSYYYITDTDNQKYIVPIKVNKKQIPFLNTNDKISVGYSNEEEITEIVEIK